MNITAFFTLWRGLWVAPRATIAIRDSRAPNAFVAASPKARRAFKSDVCAEAISERLRAPWNAWSETRGPKKIIAGRHVRYHRRAIVMRAIAM
jgi:hypothetical protein